MGDMAYIFHFQPSEMWAMDANELMLWYGQAVRINEQQS